MALPLADRQDATLDEPVHTTLVRIRRLETAPSMRSSPAMRVLHSQLRDLKIIGIKLYHVALPSGKGVAALRDCTRTTQRELMLTDLRGPVGTVPPLLHSRHVRASLYRIACMTGALSVLERTAPENSEVTVFSAVFVIVALGSIFVTLNAKVLGGQCSVFQSVCVLGYCLFPLVLDAIILEIIRIVAFHSFLLQLLLSIGAFLWSTFCMHPPCARCCAH